MNLGQRPWRPSLDFGCEAFRLFQMLRWDPTALRHAGPPPTLAAAPAAKLLAQFGHLSAALLARQYDAVLRMQVMEEREVMSTPTQPARFEQDYFPFGWFPPAAAKIPLNPHELVWIPMKPRWIPFNHRQRRLNSIESQLEPPWLTSLSRWIPIKPPYHYELSP
jgi:hypothetical protein